MKKSVLGIIFLIAALTTLLVVAAMAQNLGQTVNAENTGYIEGDLDLPLVYSFDRAIKFSSLNSYGTAGMTGGGMGATPGGVTGGSMTGTGTGNNISTSRLSIGDKSILVATSTKVYSFEKNKGRLNWQYPSNNDMENGLTCIPVAYDNKVYFSNTKILYSLDEETGEVLKMRNIPNSTIAMASVVDGILYFCAGDGKIYRLDPDTLDDAASPLSEEKVILSNGFTIKDDLLISKSSNNVLFGFDLKTGQNTFTIDVDGVIRGFMPVILDNYILVTTDKAVIVYTRSGKEHAMQKFSANLVCPPVTDGENLYVACANQNIYSLRFTNSRMEQNWKKPFNMGQTLSQIVCLQDNALLCACKSGFLFALDLEKGDICWSSQSGKVVNNSTVSIPGYTPASGMMTGMAGGATGMAGGMTGGMMAGTLGTQTINTKIVDGIEEVELESILKNYSKSFVPASIVGNVVYNGGFLAYLTSDGILQVRSNVKVADKKQPEILNYYPGYDSSSRRVSAQPPIIFRIAVTDKGSGIDFESATLTCTDSQGGTYDVKMLYDMGNQLFYGVLSKPKTAVVSPFPTGTFTVNFSVKDYAGLAVDFEYDFELDTGIQPIKTISDTSLKYLDVSTGAVYGGQLNKLIRDAESTGATKGGASGSATGINNSGSSTSAASAVSGGSSSRKLSDSEYIDDNGNYVPYDNGESSEYVVVEAEDPGPGFDGYPEEGFPPFPPL